MISNPSAPILNQDWYSKNQCEKLCDIYQEVKDLSGLIIENGCWEGKSTMALANACYPEELLCNDTWEGNIDEGIVIGQEHPTVKLLREQKVYENFIYNMDHFTKKNYKIVKEDCLKWLPTITEPVKFCHIDASHDYYSVKKTLDLVIPLMAKGGIICGDDYYCHGEAHAGGVYRAVNESFKNINVFESLWWVKV